MGQVDLAPKKGALRLAKLSGLFDSFDNLDEIAIESISRWIKPIPQEIQLENYIANRILYPQTVAITALDMQIDLAILREAIRLNGPKKNAKDIFLGNNAFLNINLRKLMIPDKFLNFVPDLATLVWVFIDALLLDKNRVDVFEDLWTVVLTDEVDEIVGSLLLPRIESGTAEIEVSVMNQNYKIKAGSLMIIPCEPSRCQISYKLREGQVLGKAEASLEVYGGKLGLVVDVRKKDAKH